MKHAVIIAACLSLGLASAARGQNALAIVKKSDDLMRGKSSYAELTMTIIKPEWSRTMSMKAWMLGTSYGLILVTDPPRDRGTVTLKRSSEVWNYIPNIERTIKIPPSMMLQSWLGSDFTNDDLVKESSIITDYSHRLTGDSTIGGHSCYRIELIPRPDAPVVWGKVILFVSREGYLQLRSEFYDEGGNLSRVLTGTDVKRMGDRTLPTHWEMVPVHEPGHKTVLDYRSWKFDIPVTEAFFSLRNMKRVH